MAVIRFGPATTVAPLMTTELDGLASNARALGNTVIDNDLDRYQFASIGLAITFTALPTADSVVSLYLLPSIDGTNYVDGSGTVAPGIESSAANFVIKNVTAQQRITVSNVALTPVKLKPLIVNTSGQAFPANGTLLRIIKYSYELV